MSMLGVKNRYGQSGTKKELYKEYEIDADAIIQAGKELSHKI